MNEMRLQGRFKGVDFKEYWLGREVEFEGHTVKVDAEMIEASNLYCEYVVKRKNEEEKSKLYIEERLDGHEIHPDLWGTTDILILLFIVNIFVNLGKNLSIIFAKLPTSRKKSKYLYI